MWLSVRAGNGHGARVARGAIAAREPETSAHGSITRGRELPGSRKYSGARRAPRPSLARNGIRLPLDQNQSSCPPKATVPVVVFTTYEPSERRVAARPVDPFFTVILAGPVKLNFSADVPTC